MHEVKDFVEAALCFFRCETERQTAGAKWIRVDKQNALFEYSKACGKVYCRCRFPDTAFGNRYSYYFGQRKSFRNQLSVPGHLFHYCTLTDKDTNVLFLESSNEASNVSPCSTRETPSGVPVNIISPGSNVMNCEM